MDDCSIIPFFSLQNPTPRDVSFAIFFRFLRQQLFCHPFPLRSIQMRCWLSPLSPKPDGGISVRRFSVLFPLFTCASPQVAMFFSLFFFLALKFGDVSSFFLACKELHPSPPPSRHWRKNPLTPPSPFLFLFGKCRSRLPLFIGMIGSPLFLYGSGRIKGVFFFFFFFSPTRFTCWPRLQVFSPKIKRPVFLRRS